MTDRIGPIDLTPDPVGDMRRRLTADPERRYVVLDGYTDEGLAAAIARAHPEYAAAMKRLRTVPADWRQSVMAAANGLTYHVAVTAAGLFEARKTDISIEAAIESEVAAFHAGRRVHRVEQLVSPDPCQGPT